MTKTANFNAYGINNAIQTVFPSPIISKRAPTVNDSAAFGQLWVNKNSLGAWILTGQGPNTNYWAAIGGSGSGVFSSLEATTGDITADLGNIVATGGSVSAGTSVSATTTVTAGTGITSTTGAITATAGAVVAGTTVTAGTGITSTTGNITATAGGIAATAGSVTAGTSISAGTSITSTLGNITTSNGNHVCSTAGTGVVLGGGAKVVCGTGDPNTAVTAPQGSLYLRLDGSSASTRAYINSNSGTTWIAVTTAS